MFSQVGVWSPWRRPGTLFSAENATVQTRLVREHGPDPLELPQIVDQGANGYRPRSCGIQAQTLVVDAGMSINDFDREIIERTMNTCPCRYPRCRATSSANHDLISDWYGISRLLA